MAASVAMLQMNYLLPLAGRPTDSFVTNDLMRLPLGILTGVGFIGGGAILRRGSLILGVTTAATLWYVTVVGLCFGGGQMLLGWLATAIGVFVLSGLRWFENFMSVEQHASLALTLEPGGPSESEIRRQLEAAAITVRDINLRTRAGTRTVTLNHGSGPKPPSPLSWTNSVAETASLMWTGAVSIRSFPAAQRPIASPRGPEIGLFL